MEKEMDLTRRVYTREMKIAAMRQLDGGRTMGQVARQMELSPKMLERWRAEWRARGEEAFPGFGRRLSAEAAGEQRVAELERKIGQQAMENDFLKKALQRLREQVPRAVVSGAAASTGRSSKPGGKADAKQ
jgi:transposase